MTDAPTAPPIAPPPAPLQLRDVRKYYGNGVAALDGVDWSVPAGSVVGLLGQNAAGKTTLIKTALGLIRPTRGEATIFGQRSWDLSAATKARIGYVPQVITLYPWMRVRQLINYTAAFYPHWNDELVRQLAIEWAVPREDK